MNDSEVKNIIETDLHNLASMAVEEYTLFRKWQEIHNKNWTGKDLDNMHNVKLNLWIPEAPDDYLKLQPKVVIANTKQHSEIWTMLRIMCSTAHWNHSPGRLGRYYVMDDVSKKYLGIISLGSDFIAIGGRDKYIGWALDQRIKNAKMLNYTAMGSSIVPTQPLGYNYLGGKLISLMVISDTIENDWNERYPNETLMGVSTTSLYGGKGMSQYTNLKYWHRCESTEGEIPLEPSSDSYATIRTWMKENYPAELNKLEGKKADGGIPTHPKARMLGFAFTKLKIKAPKNNFSRGVFFAPLYDNTKDFLCQRAATPGKKIDNRAEVLVDLWKTRYAKKRVDKLVQEGRYNTNTLYYDELVNLSWPETKERYLGDVGR